MPSGHGQKRAPVFCWLSLNGEPPPKRKKRHYWVTEFSIKGQNELPQDSSFRFNRLDWPGLRAYADAALWVQPLSLPSHKRTKGFGKASGVQILCESKHPCGCGRSCPIRPTIYHVYYITVGSPVVPFLRGKRSPHTPPFAIGAAAGPPNSCSSGTFHERWVRWVS